MTRLTKEMRNMVVHSGVKLAFSERWHAHNEERRVFADALYTAMYGTVARAASRLPAGWVARAKTLAINCPGYYLGWRRQVEGYHDEHPSGYFEMSTTRVVPQSNHEIKLDEQHPLRGEADRLAAQHAAIVKDEDELREKLRALVNAYSTVARLVQAWPQAKKLLPSSAMQPTMSTALVPVTLVPEVNRILGFTQGEKADEQV